MLVTMDVAQDGGGAVRGIVSGVIPTEELVRVFEAAAPSISVGLCGDAQRTASEQIRQAADILLDGTQDPARACDAISIGLGFEATRAVMGDVVPVTAPAATCK